MDSLTASQKKRFSTFLDKLSKDILSLKKKELKFGKKLDLSVLKEHADLTKYYRRFVSPRKVLGKVVDKAKSKFYYETEYFLGEIIARQEKYNKEVATQLSILENELEKIKKMLKKN